MPGQDLAAPRSPPNSPLQSQMAPRHRFSAVTFPRPPAEPGVPEESPRSRGRTDPEGAGAAAPSPALPGVVPRRRTAHTGRVAAHSPGRRRGEGEGRRREPLAPCQGCERRWQPGETRRPFPAEPSARRSARCPPGPAASRPEKPRSCGAYPRVAGTPCSLLSSFRALWPGLETCSTAGSPSLARSILTIQRCGVLCPPRQRRSALGRQRSSRGGEAVMP
ncbi:translation initiation factor IF-2 [Chiroxiphia lanceolata]|uniref:translation initiation factor IF-2 n=1 Tax=Chiroxiphia lanceolata TaxID=296741 RepID=UPI0013CF2947|nr:translation initiation factor IF-2 [Chiroxiphia lanceolata]